MSNQKFNSQTGYSADINNITSKVRLDFNTNVVNPTNAILGINETATEFVLLDNALLPTVESDNTNYNANLSTFNKDHEGTVRTYVFEKLIDPSVVGCENCGDYAQYYPTGVNSSGQITDNTVLPVINKDVIAEFEILPEAYHSFEIDLVGHRRICDDSGKCFYEKANSNPDLSLGRQQISWFNDLIHDSSIGGTNTPIAGIIDAKLYSDPKSLTAHYAANTNPSTTSTTQFPPYNAPTKMDDNTARSDHNVIDYSCCKCCSYYEEYNAGKLTLDEVKTKCGESNVFNIIRADNEFFNYCTSHSNPTHNVLHLGYNSQTIESISTCSLIKKKLNQYGTFPNQYLPQCLNSTYFGLGQEKTVLSIGPGCFLPCCISTAGQLFANCCLDDGHRLDGDGNVEDDGIGTDDCCKNTTTFCVITPPPPDCTNPCADRSCPGWTECLCNVCQDRTCSNWTCLCLPGGFCNPDCPTYDSCACGDGGCPCSGSCGDYEGCSDGPNNRNRSIPIAWSGKDLDGSDVDGGGSVGGCQNGISRLHEGRVNLQDGTLYSNSSLVLGRCINAQIGTKSNLYKVDRNVPCASVPDSTSNLTNYCAVLTASNPELYWKYSYSDISWLLFGGHFYANKQSRDLIYKQGGTVHFSTSVNSNLLAYKPENETHSIYHIELIDSNDVNYYLNNSSNLTSPSFYDSANAFISLGHGYSSTKSDGTNKESHPVVKKYTYYDRDNQNYLSEYRTPGTNNPRVFYATYGTRDSNGVQESSIVRKNITGLTPNVESSKMVNSDGNVANVIIYPPNDTPFNLYNPESTDSSTLLNWNQGTYSGVFGNNITSNMTSPDVPSYIRNVEKVFTWYRLGLVRAALTKDHKLFVWGATEIFPTLPAGNVIENVADVAGTCVLKLDGTVQCFTSPYAYTSPQPPSGLTDVVQLSSNEVFPYTNMIAVKSDGTVVHWATSDQYRTSKVIRDKILSLTNVKQITLSPTEGNSFNISIITVLFKDGTVKNFTDDNQPTSLTSQIIPPTGLNSVKSIVQTNGSICALKNDGTVVCWGIASYAAAGSVYRVYKTFINVPSDLKNVKSVLFVGASGDTVVAIKYDGTIVYWGSQTLTEEDGTTGNVFNSESNHFINGMNKYVMDGVKIKHIDVDWFQTAVVLDTQEEVTDWPRTNKNEVYTSIGRQSHKLNVDDIQDDATVIQWDNNFNDKIYHNTITPTDTLQLADGSTYRNATSDKLAISYKNYLVNNSIRQDFAIITDSRDFASRTQNYENYKFFGKLVDNETVEITNGNAIADPNGNVQLYSSTPVLSAKILNEVFGNIDIESTTDPKVITINACTYSTISTSPLKIKITETNDVFDYGTLVNSYSTNGDLNTTAGKITIKLDRKYTSFNATNTSFVFMFKVKSPATAFTDSITYDKTGTFSIVTDSDGTPLNYQFNPVKTYLNRTTSLLHKNEFELFTINSARFATADYASYDGSLKTQKTNYDQHSVPMRGLQYAYYKRDPSKNFGVISEVDDYPIIRTIRKNNGKFYVQILAGAFPYYHPLVHEPLLNHLGYKDYGLVWRNQICNRTSNWYNYLATTKWTCYVKHTQFGTNIPGWTRVNETSATGTGSAGKKPIVIGRNPTTAQIAAPNVPEQPPLTPDDRETGGRGDRIAL